MTSLDTFIRSLTPWLFSHGVRILFIVVGAAVIARVARGSIRRLQHGLSHHHQAQQLDPEWQRRASTISRLLSRLTTTLVLFIAALMLLRELSIDVVPILTGAGIAGLAVGFGAQNLVRDVISGFFMILEDQVRIGDLARINGVSGTVEQINLRTIILRDDEGGVQVFPSGSITSLANMSKQFSNAIVDVRVAYSENIDQVLGAIRETAEIMAGDSEWEQLVLGPLDVQGVQSLDDGAATIRMKFKTLPLNQGKVANELRRRLMVTFLARGIRLHAGDWRIQ